jgi:hypothetical protein
MRSPNAGKKIGWRNARVRNLLGEEGVEKKECNESGRTCVPPEDGRRRAGRPHRNGPDTNGSAGVKDR